MIRSSNRMISRRSLFKAGAATVGSMLLSSRSVFAQSNASYSSAYGIVNQRAPELRAEFWIDEEGHESQPFKISDNQGKWIFLKCFQNWCPGCHKHGLPAMQKISRALSDNPKVAFAGIQTVFEGSLFNTRGKVRKIQLKYDLKMPMAHDPGIDRSFTMMDYRTGGTPWIILIDPSRRVVFNDFSINADRVIDFINEQTLS